MKTQPVTTRARSSVLRLLLAVLAVLAALTLLVAAKPSDEPPALHQETKELVSVVDEAAGLVAEKGEAAFDALRAPDSRFRRGERYIFVLDPEGNMLVHPDQAMEGKNQLGLKDVDGRPIIRGLIDAAAAHPDQPGGFYHYQWPVPGGLLPRWKTSYVRLVTAPGGKRLVVGAGIYDDRMEKAFVVAIVKDAVRQVERLGEQAFPLFRDPIGAFRAKDAYVFVVDPSGVDLVNPAFPSLEGRNLLDVKDTQGKRPIREMLSIVESRGSGWVDYSWPKPGESASTQKSAYVSKARLGDKWVLVGCGAYLADAPKAAPKSKKLSAEELRALVREAATVFERRGEAAYPEFRSKGSKWFRDDTYFFVWSMDGVRSFHAADPALEGKPGRDAKDVHGKPYGKMFLEVAQSPSGEGWVHYLYPEPGSIFPAWKSAFLKRVEFPSGKQYLVGAGIYDMQMNEGFIVDLVDRASALVAEEGKKAFEQLRDEKGPFRFMDVYVFVDTPEGVELVNPAQPSLEGKNILDLKDVKGKALAREYIPLTLKKGSAWVEYYWYRPGENTVARKKVYLRKVQSGGDTYIVGSGVYL